MSDAIYQWYKATKKRIKDIESATDDHESMKSVVDECIEALHTMEIACPGIKERYQRNKAVQESFTREQIDFICYQIGDWYLEWKERIITDLEQGTHRLGYAKEQLKTMICGD